MANSLPSISHRSSIAWQSLAASTVVCPQGTEDSAVLVLTSRSYLPSELSTLSLSDPNASLEVSMFVDLRLTLPLSSSSAVSWAFAGLRHKLHTDPPRYRWDHLIDSRGPGGPEDVGEVMSFDYDEVEVGEGLNPNTGRLERYFETWSEENPPSNSAYIFLSNSCSQTTSFMAVIGQHALAMAQSSGGGFMVVRMSLSQFPADSQAWHSIYTTPNSAPLERQLTTLLRDLDDYVRGRKRADELKLTPKDHEAEGTVWTLFDCGFVRATA